LCLFGGNLYNKKPKKRKKTTRKEKTKQKNKKQKTKNKKDDVSVFSVLSVFVLL